MELSPRFEPAPKQRLSRFLLAVTLTAVAFSGLYKMRIEPALHGIPVHFEELVFQEKVLLDGVTPLKTRFTGLSPLDDMLSMLVGAFMPGITGVEGPQVRLQQWYFLTQWFGVLCFWTVEGFREGNKGRVASFTTLFAIIYQAIGAAFIVPLYYVFWLYSSPLSSSQDLSSGRHQKLVSNTANALLPALFLGYLLPTLALYCTPTDNLDLLQTLAAVWQPAPFLPNLLVQLAAALFSLSGGSSPPQPSSKTKKRQSKSEPESESESDDTDTGGNEEAARIRGLHIYSGLICTTSHLWFVYSCLVTQNVSPLSVLLPDPSARALSTSQGLLWTFQWDFWFCFGSTLLFLLLGPVRNVLLAGLNKKGGDAPVPGVTLAQITEAGLGMVLVSVALGPGTAVASTSYWIEKALSRGGAKKDQKEERRTRKKDI